MIDIPIKNKYFFFIILIFVATFASLYRYSNLSYEIFTGTYLWAEDGNIFHFQAQSFGLKSFFLPYAGYLHLYQRIFAFLASFLSIRYTPTIYLLGFYLSIIIFIYTVISFYFNKNNIIKITLLIVMVVIQPFGKEVYFSLTNVQWIIGLSVSIMVIEFHRIFKINFFIWLLIILTGPWTIIMFPIFLYKLIKLNKFNKKYVKYIITYFVVAILQIYFAVNHRDFPKKFNYELENWLTFGKTFLGFGVSSDSIYFYFSISIFIVLLINLISNLFESRNKSKIYNLIIFTLTVFTTSVLYNFKDQPQIISPIGAGGRYFFIPFSLLYFLILFHANILKKTLVILMLIIFIVNNKHIKSENKSINIEKLIYAENNEFYSYIHINPIWDTKNNPWILEINVDKK